MSFLAQFENEQLDAIAKKERPRCSRWVGAKNTSSVRRYVCYICGREIDTESNNHRPTKHAEEAIDEHMASHLEDLK